MSRKYRRYPLCGTCCEAPLFTPRFPQGRRVKECRPGRIDGKSRSDEDQTDKKQVADQAHRQQTQPGNRHQVMGQAKGNEYRKDEGSDIYDKEISAADRRIDIEKHNDEDNPCNKSYGLCGDKVFHKLTVVDILVEGPEEKGSHQKLQMLEYALVCRREKGHQQAAARPFVCKVQQSADKNRKNNTVKFNHKSHLMFSI